MSDGGGPSPAAYNPNTMGGGSSIGQIPAGQAWLCGWFFVLDGKRFTALQEICNFDKPIIRVADIKLLPQLSQNCSHLPFGSILAEIFEILKKGGGIESWAADLVPAEIRQIMSANEIHGEDASHVSSIRANFAMQNLARNSVDHEIA